MVPTPRISKPADRKVRAPFTVACLESTTSFLRHRFEVYVIFKQQLGKTSFRTNSSETQIGAEVRSVPHFRKLSGKVGDDGKHPPSILGICSRLHLGQIAYSISALRSEKHSRTDTISQKANDGLVYDAVAHIPLAWSGRLPSSGPTPNSAAVLQDALKCEPIATGSDSTGPEPDAAYPVQPTVTSTEICASTSFSGDHGGTSLAIVSNEYPDPAFPPSLTATKPGTGSAPNHAEGHGECLAGTIPDTSFFLTEVAIERTDNLDGANPRLNLSGLCILGIPGSEEGVQFVIGEGFVQRWGLPDIVVLPACVESITCIVKGDEGEDVAFVHLVRSEITEDVQSGHGYRKDMVTLDEQVQLTLSYKAADTNTLLQSGMRVPERPPGSLAPKNPPLIYDGTPYGIRLASGRPSPGARIDPSEPGFHNGIKKSIPSSSLSPACGKCLFASAEKLALMGYQSVFTDLYASGRESMLLFERTRNPIHIRNALSTLQYASCAMELAKDRLPQTIEAVHLHNTAVQLKNQFEATGSLDTITEAIEVQERALQLLPEPHPDVLPGAVNNLASLLCLRYERTGDMSDLAESLATRRRLVMLTPEGHKDLPAQLNNLSTSLMHRFERTRDASDITEAIAVQERAVQLTQEGDPALPDMLNNRGVAFSNRFKCSRDPSDLNEAISSLQRAVSVASENHDHLPGILSNVGNFLKSRFRLLRDLSDLAEAISTQEKAVQLTPDGHAGLPDRLTNLGASLNTRFKHTGELVDITRAIPVFERAVELTPKGHPDLPARLKNLAAGLRLLWLHTGTEEALTDTLAAFRLAATCESGPPRVRLGAAKRWANLLFEHAPQSPDIIDACDAISRAVALIAGLEQTLSGRYSRLKDVSGIALGTASGALSLERADRALEWLEQGRCVVWGQLSKLRAPLDELFLHNRQLAQRVMALSAQLDGASSSRQSSHTTTSLEGKAKLEGEALDHLNLATEWEDLLENVRSLPGFETFLQPATCSTLLQHLPESGPIVIINVGRVRCDAIALIHGLPEPLHIPLSNFSMKKADRFRRNLKERLQKDGLRMRGAGTDHQDETERKPLAQKQSADSSASVPEVAVLRDILGGLWLDVVKPILDALGFSGFDSNSGEQPPRIWWCPTGPLSFLPLHAAGVFKDGSCESILDYAVSSYTPTVTAITERVRNHRPIDKSTSGLFLVSQPNAIGMSRILGTVKEVEGISSKAEEKGLNILKRVGEEVSGEDCLEHMEEFSSVHLACHASQDAAEPLKSCFYFHNDTLDLATIIQRNLRNADLAFLSACQTSVGEEKLSDEAVHLAAGMLAAGYRRVVATMWSISDRHGPKVAERFYQHLWDHQADPAAEGFDGTGSAYALHHAISELRRELNDNSESSLLAWVPYVHFGY
ncbi:hypothetical protein NMY22_g513 [Coprinellus aureogranulatus]|nr:hypothetical protein NMY22_g513 [Coprinellus aureogranulatus]